MDRNTSATMVEDARSRVECLSPIEVAAALDGDAILVDVREPHERVEEGVIAGDISAPRGMVEFWADSASPHHRPEFDPGRRTILYCASGGRSALAADALRRLGYVRAAHLDGGLQAWKESGRPVETPEGVPAGGQDGSDEKGSDDA